jgi:hypothetical protein
MHMAKKLNIKKLDLTGTLTSGSSTVSGIAAGSIDQLVVGDTVFGTGIPSQTRVRTIDTVVGSFVLGDSTLANEVNATASGSTTITIMTDDVIVKKAERLASAVSINGVSFDGSEDVTITTQALTAEDALDLIITVDGTGSELDADLLDGEEGSYYASREYVDEVAQGLKAAPAAEVATTANLSATYNNGTAGVGATLTATANGAFPTIDGYTLTSTTLGTSGVLVKNQTNAAHNGRYNLTQQGTASLPWILTKCQVCDEADEIPGSYIFVKHGTLYANTGWIANVADQATFTVGTDAVNYFQFSGVGTFTAGDGLDLTGSEFSVDTDRVVTRDVNGDMTATSASVDFIQLTTETNDLNITEIAGRIFYNEDEDTVNIVHSLGVMQQVGQEFFLPPTNNNSGVQINNGEFVMVTGIAGNSDRMSIAKAVTNGSVNSMYMVGVATVDIPDGSEIGKITTNGLVRKVNTNAWIKGTILYPNPAVPGGWTNAVPTAPAIKTPIAIVIRQGTINGILYIRMTTGSRLGETDSNVEFVSLADKQMIAYNGANSRWENTTNLGWDFTNSRLGVGTNTPQAKLDISDLTLPTIRLTNLGTNIAQNAELGRIDFFNSDESGAGPKVEARISTFALGSSGIGGGLAFFTGRIVSSPEGEEPLERMRIIDNGNVGIGTTNPTQRLDITGNARVSGSFISTLATGTAPLTVSSQTKVTNLYSERAENADKIATSQKSDNINYNIPFVQSVTASNQLLYTDSVSSITYNPSTDRLTVPNLTVTGNITVNNVDMISTSNGIVFEGATDDNFETTLYAIDPIADRSILLPDASGTVALTSQLDDIIDGTTELIDTRIKNSATNVIPLIVNGIEGTTARLQDWQINGNILAYVTSFGRVQASGFGNNESANNALLSTNTTGTVISRNIADANTALTVNQVHASSTGDILKVQAAGVDRLTVKRDGNVGIGITSPSEKLDIDGNLRVSGFIKTDVDNDELVIHGGNTIAPGTNAPSYLQLYGNQRSGREGSAEIIIRENANSYFNIGSYNGISS